MRRWLLLVLLVLWPSIAHAHVRSVSWSTWTIGRRAGSTPALSPSESIVGTSLDVRVRMSALDLSAVGDADAYLRAHLHLEPCVLESRGAEPSEAGFVVRTLHARCPDGAALRVTSDLFLDLIPSHLHFATLSRDGVVVAEQMLSRDRQVWELPRERTGMRFSEMVSVGVRHILSGADHLVFLVTLLVAAASLRALAAIVTGFTLGHSAALILAVLFGVRPQSSAIEALVGATIAIVAIENVWLARRDPWLPRLLLVGLAAVALFAGLGPRLMIGLLLFVACYFGLVARAPERTAIRGSVTALFGLVHGFAFSTVLTEMALPRARLASALFGFNLGVELGQLAIIALAWPVWRFVARTRMRNEALDLASAAALAAGVFWFVSRAIA